MVAPLDGRIDAIIRDALVLEFYAHIHSGDTIKMAGAIFEPDKYGFAAICSTTTGISVCHCSFGSS